MDYTLTAECGDLSALTFDEFKHRVVQLAKEQKLSFLMPNDEALTSLFNEKLTPKQVVEKLSRVSRDNF